MSKIVQMNNNHIIRLLKLSTMPIYETEFLLYTILKEKKQDGDRVMRITLDEIEIGRASCRERV